jgi:hypothetical protein
MAVFLLQGEVAWLNDISTSHPDFFEKVSKIKAEMTPKSLCDGQAKGLLPFVKEIFNY